MSANKGRAKRGGARGRRGERAAPTRVETLRIESLAVGGAGVARRESGEVVFVPGVAAGEVVEADVETGKSPARAMLRRVITKSADRVEPPCRFVGTCGGCDWMHLTAEAQSKAHAAIVAHAIAHATGVAEADLPTVRVHAAAAPLGFRTRARLLVRAVRNGVHVGYRAAGSHELAEIDRCVVLHPSLEALTPWARSASVTLDGRWLGGTMELVDEADTVSEDGRLGGRAMVADDNFFWLEPGESRELSAEILWREPETKSNATFVLKAFNGEAKPVHVEK